MNTRKKIIIIFVVCLIIVGLMSLLVFTEYGKNLLNFSKTKGVLIEKETGRLSAYSVEILEVEDIEKKSVKGWINNNIHTEKPNDDQVYYTLYDNAAEGMNMYLFMQEAKIAIGNINRSNIKVYEMGTSLMIYIDTNEGTINNGESSDLILHIYIKSKNAKAKTERLIINGKTYSSASSTFMMLD